MAPLTDDSGDNKDFINALTYLGKGPYNIGLPGGADINVGAGPAPAPGVNVGTFGQRLGVGGPAESGAVGPGGSSGSSGSDTLALLQKFLGAGGKSADFLSRLGGDQTRGDTGGISLSDMLRGGPGSAGSTGGTGSAGSGVAAGVDLTRTLGETIDPSTEATLQNFLGQGLSPDEIQDVMGGLEQVGAGGIGGGAGGAASTAGGLG